MVIFPSYVSLPEGKTLEMYSSIYPLVNVYITNWKITIRLMETHPVQIAMFNSYVKLPVGSFLQAASAVNCTRMKLYSDALLFQYHNVNEI